MPTSWNWNYANFENTNFDKNSGKQEQLRCIYQVVFVSSSGEEWTLSPTPTVIFYNIIFQ